MWFSPLCRCGTCSYGTDPDPELNACKRCPGDPGETDCMDCAGQLAGNSVRGCMGQCAPREQLHGKLFLILRPLALCCYADMVRCSDIMIRKGKTTTSFQHSGWPPHTHLCNVRLHHGKPAVSYIYNVFCF